MDNPSVFWFVLISIYTSMTEQTLSADVWWKALENIQEWAFTLKFMKHNIQFLLVSCQLKQGIRRLRHQCRKSSIILKTLPVLQALGHKTQVNMRTNKFCMNYWWILEAGFLLSPSEPPVIEPWLWQHAQEVTTSTRDTGATFFMVISRQEI